MVCKTVTVDVDVDVELSEIDTDDLIEELATRGPSGYVANVSDLITAMHTAFYTGREARAMELAREIAEAHTGKMVPTKTGALNGTAPQT